jgi:hypothetical protein
MATKTDYSQDWLSLIEFYSPQHLSILKGSSDEVLNLMQHEDPFVRAAAIVAGHAIWKWRDHTQFMNKCCCIAANDSHESPRQEAITVLHAVFIGSNNSSAQQSLACVVIDENASPMMRNNAYRAIRAILKESYSRIDFSRFKEDTTLEMSNKPVQLMSIDWNFIDQLCYKKKRGTQ